jgi:hypothetical protein
MVPLSFWGDALLFGGNDVERHDGQHCAVHGHRHRHAIEGNLIEQHLHVEDRVDGHSGLADVPVTRSMVGVVAAVRSQVECDGEPFLSRGQVAAIERVGLFGGREAGILANRPGLHHVHGAVRATQIWGEFLLRSGGVRRPPRPLSPIAVARLSKTQSGCCGHE